MTQTAFPPQSIINVPTARLLGRATAGTGAAETLDATAGRTLLGLGTTDNPELAGASFGVTASNGGSLVSILNGLRVQGVRQLRLTAGAGWEIVSESLHNLAQGVYFGNIQLNPGLYSNSTQTLFQRNGLNAQSSRIYNTYTNASNGEWFEIDWQTTANVCRLATNNNGTGTKRNIVLDSANRSAYIASPTNAEIRDILISFGLMAAA